MTAFSSGKYYLTPTPSDLAVYMFTAREAAIPYSVFDALYYS